MHRNDDGSLPAYYHRRLPNFYTIKDRRMGVDEELNSSSTRALRFFIDYDMNELTIID